MLAGSQKFLRKLESVIPVILKAFDHFKNLPASVPIFSYFIREESNIKLIHFNGVGNGSRRFKNTIANRPSESGNLENVPFHRVGWVGVGGMGYQMGPLIFFMLRENMEKVNTLLYIL